MPKRNEEIEEPVFERLRTGLEKTYCVSAYTSYAQDILDGKPIDKILRESHQHKLILAVTSESFQELESDSKMAPPKVFARLHSLCELEHGIMLVWEFGTSLAKLHKKSKGPKDHLPRGIQRRIDFMLGNANFMPNVLNTVPLEWREHFMIMGARIMHKSLHEKKTTKHVPSIAAVVASTNGTALHFPGSARFQRTTAELTASTRIPQHSIPEFEGMLIERFQAWAN